MLWFLYNDVCQYLWIIIYSFDFELTLKWVNNQRIIFQFYNVIYLFFHRGGHSTPGLKTLSWLNPVTHTSFPIHHITAGSQSGRSGSSFSTESATIASLNFFNDHSIVFLKFFLIAPAESLLIFLWICSIMTCSNISILLVHDRYAFSCQFTLRFTFSIASLIRASHI